MNVNKYKVQKWYKELEKQWPDFAKLVNDAYEEIEKRPYYTLLSSRSFIEGTMDYIGQEENIIKLRLKDDDKNIPYTELKEKINVMVNSKIITKQFHSEIKQMVYICNRLHSGYAANSYESTLAFVGVLNYAEWFVGKYGRKNNLSDENVVKIKVCSNQKQCGRMYTGEAIEEYTYCNKCGAPLDEKEHIIENIPSFDVYELVGEEKEHVLRGNIQLELDEMILGRKNHAYTPDIDLSEFIECEDNKNIISRKHLMVYKRAGNYVIKNISQDNYVIIEDIHHGNDQGLRFLEGEEIEVLEDMDNVFVHEILRLNYKAR